MAARQPISLRELGDLLGSSLLANPNDVDRDSDDELEALTHDMGHAFINVGAAQKRAESRAESRIGGATVIPAGTADKTPAIARSFLFEAGAAAEAPPREQAHRKHAQKERTAPKTAPLLTRQRSPLERLRQNKRAEILNARRTPAPPEIRAEENITPAGAPADEPSDKRRRRG